MAPGARVDRGSREPAILRSHIAAPWCELAYPRTKIRADCELASLRASHRANKTNPGRRCSRSDAGRPSLSCHAVHACHRPSLTLGLATLKKVKKKSQPSEPASAFRHLACSRVMAAMHRHAPCFARWRPMLSWASGWGVTASVISLCRQSDRAEDARPCTVMYAFRCARGPSDLRTEHAQLAGQCGAGCAAPAGRRIQAHCKSQSQRAHRGKAPGVWDKVGSRPEAHFRRLLARSQIESSQRRLPRLSLDPGSWVCCRCEWPQGKDPFGQGGQGAVVSAERRSS